MPRVRYGIVLAASLCLLASDLRGDTKEVPVKVIGADAKSGVVWLKIDGDRTSSFRVDHNQSLEVDGRKAVAAAAKAGMTGTIQMDPAPGMAYLIRLKSADSTGTAAGPVGEPVLKDPKGTAGTAARPAPSKTEAAGRPVVEPVGEPVLVTGVQLTGGVLGLDGTKGEHTGGRIYLRNKAGKTAEFRSGSRLRIEIDGQLRDVASVKSGANGALVLGPKGTATIRLSSVIAAGDRAAATPALEALVTPDLLKRDRPAAAVEILVAKPEAVECLNMDGTTVKETVTYLDPVGGKKYVDTVHGAQTYKVETPFLADKFAGLRVGDKWYVVSRDRRLVPAQRNLIQKPERATISLHHLRVNSTVTGELTSLDSFGAKLTPDGGEPQLYLAEEVGGKSQDTLKRGFAASVWVEKGLYRYNFVDRRYDFETREAVAKRMAEARAAERATNEQLTADLVFAAGFLAIVAKAVTADGGAGAGTPAAAPAGKNTRTLVGRLTNDRGEPMKNTKIVLYGPVLIDPSEVVTTDGDGRFRATKMSQAKSVLVYFGPVASKTVTLDKTHYASDGLLEISVK